jgi:maltooligosyltrehalose trehalohydrolase
VTTFRVWAPEAKAVSVVVARPDDDPEPRAVDLSPADGGWWRVDVPEAGAGTDYAFHLDGAADELPDPRSAWQPHGVHGRSRLVDHGQFGWTDAGWRGLPLAGSVLYELHVGTFTREGTFDAAVERLGHLVDLGVDAVELLPCAAFPGEHGWGYDGVDLFAVHDPYGGPDGLKRFVDAAHARGLGVVMDVVHNHLGPDGNYLARFGPYFTDTYATPWGAAVNLDGSRSDEVRRFLLDNATMWLRDYHCDGLRLDAVHALLDRRAVHLLEDISVTAHRLSAALGRAMFVIAESDLNDPRMVTSTDAGGLGMDGQWSDDLHHALWATLSGERQGYYADFGSLPTLAKAMERVFVHDGTYSSFRGRRHGRPVPPAIPRHRFVTFLQDHDQIGNRAGGDRASASLSPGRLRIGAALLLTSPFTPMLFMGEEWGASTPWQFFTDHTDPGLAEAVRSGRRAEFVAHGWGPEDVPDPQDPATFAASKLNWTEAGDEPQAGLLHWYRRLIGLRRAEGDLTDDSAASTRCAYDPDGQWFVLYRGAIAVVCNLSEEQATVPVDGVPYEVPLSSANGFTFRSGQIELAAESVVIARLVHQ